MSLACPRCESALVPRTAPPRPGEPPITAQVCERCGLWLDGDTLVAALGQLGTLSDRRELLPVPPTGALTCPRCRVPCGRVQHSGVWLDVCRTCAGVWFDAGEYEAIARTERRKPPSPPRRTPPPAPAAAPSPAVIAARSPYYQEIHCAACGAAAARSLTYITARGNVCAACHLKTEAAAQNARAAASLENDRATDAVVDGFWIAGLVLEVVSAIIDIADV